MYCTRALRARSEEVERDVAPVSLCVCVHVYACLHAAPETAAGTAPKQILAGRGGAGCMWGGSGGISPSKDFRPSQSDYEATSVYIFSVGSHCQGIVICYPPSTLYHFHFMTVPILMCISRVTKIIIVRFTTVY